MVKIWNNVWGFFMYIIICFNLKNKMSLRIVNEYNLNICNWNIKVFVFLYLINLLKKGVLSKSYNSFLL